MTTFRFSMSNLMGAVGVGFVLLGVPMGMIRAQSSPDAIAALTRALQTGPLQAREDALAELTRGPVSRLPRPTRAALIVELTRIHTAMLAGRPLATPDEGELFSDYYMSLVSAVAELRTPEASLALAPAVAVSGGVARRVARLGDLGVDAVLPLLRRQYEVSSMLETLGLAWYWADSTHAALSDRSRARIASAITAAAESDSSEDIAGAERALENIGDPAFLPLATSMANRVDSVSAVGAIVASTLRSSVIPRLTAGAAARSPVALAAIAARAITAVCAPRDADDEDREGAPTSGRRRQHGHSNRCAALAHDFSAASRSIQLGRIAEARTTLRELGRRIEQAFAARELTRMEHDVMAGNVSMLLARLAP